MLTTAHISLALGALGSALVSPVAARAFDLPSGLRPDLSQVLIDQVGEETWARFRFLAPAVAHSHADAVGFEQIEGDFAVLCADLAMPYLKKHELSADKVVISLSDRFVEFGMTDANATQYFEQFRLEGGDCIWEGL